MGYYNETDFMSMTAQNKDYGMGNPNTHPSKKTRKRRIRHGQVDTDNSLQKSKSK